MKTLSKKIAIIGGLLIVASLLASNAALADSGDTRIEDIFMTTTTFGVLPVNRANTCGGNTWWGFNHTTTAGGRMMAMLMAAHLSGGTVRLLCSGLHDAGPNGGFFNRITTIWMR